MQQGWLTKTFKGDRAIWGLVALFMFYSLLAVYSSSVGVAFMKHGGNTTYFLKSQFITLIFSLGLIVIVHYLPYRIYFSMAGLILICSVGLLVLTFVIGSRVNEAMRSIPIPGLGRLQTSDVAKVALVLYLARSLAKYQKDLNNFLLVTKYFIVPIGIVCGLIMPENLSTAILVFGMSMIIMFIGRVPVKFIMAYIGIGVVGVLLFAILLTVIKKDNNRVQVWKNRIEHFFSSKGDEDGDYQSNQAKIAISTGGLFGKAPGKSTQRNMLPQSNSDFIFAIIIEEYGLLFGAIPLILAYMILLFRGITIAKKCETAFPAFLVLGLIVMIVIQAMINMMVAVGLFPVTGQTLPMVSWGRTSVLVMSFSIGAILSVSRVVNARIKKEELPEEEISDEGERIYEPAKT
jgi:cell division protein FtsW